MNRLLHTDQGKYFKEVCDGNSLTVRKGNHVFAKEGNRKHRKPKHAEREYSEFQ